MFLSVVNVSLAQVPLSQMTQTGTSVLAVCGINDKDMDTEKRKVYPFFYKDLL